MALVEYGNEYEVIGAFLPGLKKFVKKAVKVYTAPMKAAFKLSTIPQRAVLAKLRKKKFKLFGEEVICGSELDAELIGAFLPGLKKALKTVGKFTSPITTSIAKKFLPASLVDAAAKLDPTKKGAITPKAISALTTIVDAKAATEKLATTPAQIQTQAIKKTLTNPIVIGTAAVSAGLIIFMLTRKKRR